MSLGRVMTATHESVLRLSTVKGKEFIGNGFVVHYSDNISIIMTCEHCVKKLTQVICTFHDKIEVVADVSHMDKSRDVALLTTILPHPYPQLSFLESPQPQPEQKVVILGYLSMREGTVMTSPAAIPGKIIGDPWIKEKEPNLIEFIQADYGSKRGMSGAPVIEEILLRVVGMHCNAERGAKHAVSARTVRRALQTWGEGTSIRSILQNIAAEIIKERRRDLYEDGPGTP